MFKKRFPPPHSVKDEFLRFMASTFFYDYAISFTLDDLFSRHFKRCRLRRLSRLDTFALFISFRAKKHDSAYRMII